MFILGRNGEKQEFSSLIEAKEETEMESSKQESSRLDSGEQRTASRGADSLLRALHHNKRKFSTLTQKTQRNLGYFFTKKSAKSRIFILQTTHYHLQTKKYHILSFLAEN